MARTMKLIDAPVGLFECNDILVLKTEYSTKHEDGTITPDCYIVESGEYFWGDAKTAKGRNNLEVIPIDNSTTLILPKEPLTLEQLHKMDGKPVWLHTFSSKSKKTNIEEWALIASSSEYSVSFVRVAVSGRMEKRCSDYGKTWLAYSYPVPHIDR